MMQGRRHYRPLHGKARAMACGGNPRALPDLRGDAVPPTPRKKGSRPQSFGTSPSYSAPCR